VVLVGLDQRAPQRRLGSELEAAARDKEQSQHENKRTHAATSVSQQIFFLRSFMPLFSRETRRTTPSFRFKIRTKQLTKKTRIDNGEIAMPPSFLGDQNRNVFGLFAVLGFDLGKERMKLELFSFCASEPQSRHRSTEKSWIRKMVAIGNSATAKLVKK
jgi:hypothetical protein